ncbi:unnamed protein product [Moneuplotes crassus]|uniref:Uncharacterized protein n=1 Tax=Euplotes crassus TaxID=5936 RepID=A0AAD2D1Y2_EUPCR|nr:unnamed protein product [Moneuplotes crassus]
MKDFCAIIMDLFLGIKSLQSPLLRSGANKDKQTRKLTEKITQIYYLKKPQLECHFSEHDKREKCSLRYSNAADIHNFEYKGDSIYCTLHIDGIASQQYLMPFERKKISAKKRQSKLKASQKC